MNYYDEIPRGRQRRRSPIRDLGGRLNIDSWMDGVLAVQGRRQPYRSGRTYCEEDEPSSSYESLPSVTRGPIVQDRHRERSRSAGYYKFPPLRQQRSRSIVYRTPAKEYIIPLRQKSIERRRSGISPYGIRLDSARSSQQGFRHRSLNDPTRQHRLIKVLPYRSGSPVRCIVHHAEPGMEKWTALSYNWGTEETRAQILIGYAPDSSDARPLLVTKNLSNILSHIAWMRRSDRDRRRWSGWWWYVRASSINETTFETIFLTLCTRIDALCIIQDEQHQEKDIQIRCMPNFYVGASEVFAWIGPGDAITDQAMRYIRRRVPSLREAAERGRVNLQLAHFEETFHEVALCVRDIFRKPYWRRLWILQELALSPKTTLVCGNEELSWRMFIDFATQVAVAKFNSDRVLQHIREEILEKQPVWLLTRIFQHRKRVPNLAELVFLAKDAECGKDKKDYVRALLGLVDRGHGQDIDPEKHQSACSIISHATRAMIQDMWDDERIPEFIKRRCERLAQFAHHSPLTIGPNIDSVRARCTNYEDAQQDCRDIAATMYEQTTLLRSRTKLTGETWDFQYDYVRRRRRSRSRSRSGSRSSVATATGVVAVAGRENVSADVDTQ